MVAILAVLTAWANVQRQISTTAREAWMRELREKAALLLSIQRNLWAGQSLEDGLDLEMISQRDLARQTLRFLVAEKGQYGDLDQATDRLLRAGLNVPGNEFLPSIEAAENEFTDKVIDILRRERAAMVSPWRPWSWSRLKVWLERSPPRFPT